VNPRALPVKVVQEVLERGARPADVSRIFGVAVTTITTWCKAYQAGGPEALIPRPMVPPVRKPRTPDPKREAVAALKREQPELGTRRISDLLKRFEALGVSETQVRRILHEEGLLEDRPPAPAREHAERRFERAAPDSTSASGLRSLAYPTRPRTRASRAVVRCVMRRCDTEEADRRHRSLGSPPLGPRARTCTPAFMAEWRLQRARMKWDPESTRPSRLPPWWRCEGCG